MSKQRTRKTTKPRTAGPDLRKDQAAIIFSQDGAQLILPDDAPPHVQFAIALWCRMKDNRNARWRAKHPDQWRAIMRDYMRRYRAGSRSLESGTA